MPSAALQTPGFLRRLLCLSYEIVLLAAVILTAAAPLLAIGHLSGIAVPRGVIQGYMLVVAACYFIPQWRAGHTLPMKTWRIRVVSAANTRLTLAQSALRYVFAILSWALLGAGYLWALLDRDGQFLHDWLAGTRLVATPR